MKTVQINFCFNKMLFILTINTQPVLCIAGNTKYWALNGLTLKEDTEVIVFVAKLSKHKVQDISLACLDDIIIRANCEDNGGIV